VDTSKGGELKKTATSTLSQEGKLFQKRNKKEKDDKLKKKRGQPYPFRGKILKKKWFCSHPEDGGTRRDLPGEKVCASQLQQKLLQGMQPSRK